MRLFLRGFDSFVGGRGYGMSLRRLVTGGYRGGETALLRGFAEWGSSCALLLLILR